MEKWGPGSGRETRVLTEIKGVCLIRHVGLRWHTACCGPPSQRVTGTSQILASDVA